MDWIYLRWVLFYLSPAIPLALVWQSIAFSPQSRRFLIWFPAAVGTTSIAWIAVALLSQSVLGPAYSNVRGYIILGNLMMTVGCGLCCFVLSIFPLARRLHILTGAACIVIGVCWLLTLAANVAV